MNIKFHGIFYSEISKKIANMLEKISYWIFKNAVLSSEYRVYKRTQWQKIPTSFPSFSTVIVILLYTLISVCIAV